MDPEQWIKSLDMGVRLLQSLTWPVVAVFLVLYFGKPLRDVLSNIHEGKFKASATGIEASFKRGAEAAIYLGLAQGKKQVSAAQEAGSGNGEPLSDELVSPQIADSVAQAVSPRSIQRLANTTVLWVDDHPDNNLYEMKALRALGINVSTSTSTEDALKKLKSNDRQYSAVISDMGRGSDQHAGYHLLEEIRKLAPTTPFIIYAGSSSPEQKEEARRRGAFGNTSSPQELLRLVTSALGILPESTARR